MISKGYIQINLRLPCDNIMFLNHQKVPKVAGACSCSKESGLGWPPLLFVYGYKQGYLFLVHELCPSSRTFKPMTMQVNRTNFFILASNNDKYRSMFWTFYGKLFGIVIWDIAIRSGKWTFFENTIRKCCYFYYKNFKIPFLWTIFETM